MCHSFPLFLFCWLACRFDGWSLSSHLSPWWKHCTETAESRRDKEVSDAMEHHTWNELSPNLLEHCEDAIPLPSDLDCIWWEVCSHSYACLCLCNVCNVFISITALKISFLLHIVAIWLWCTLVWFSFCVSVLKSIKFLDM